jgi:hypothetical protein
MKKLLAMSLCAVALAICVYGHCAAQSKTTDFSGAWELDKSKTADLPSTLESYTMTVTQDAQQITVENNLQGEIGPRGGMGQRGAGRRGGGGGGFPGGGGGFPGGGGGGFPGGGPGGGGPPGGGMGGGMPKEMVMGMALRMAPPKVTYSLDGKETTVEMEGREDGRTPPGGSLAVKANWKNNGKVLELQSTRKINTPDGDERSMTGKDRWELSNDGQTLTVKRSVETPMGSNEVKLVFNKQ